MMVDAVEREDELEEVTDVLLVSRSDDLNTVAAAVLRAEVGHGHVFRVAPTRRRRICWRRRARAASWGAAT